MDLTSVQFVIAPGRFPKHQPYVLIEDEWFVPDTLTFLRALAPDAPYHGTVPVGIQVRGVAREDAVVVSSDHWYDAVARLLAAGFPPERIIVLLNTFNDGYGYLDVGRVCPEHIGELADPAVPVEQKIAWMRPQLLRFGVCQRFDGDRPVWNPNCFFGPYRELVRENAAAVQKVTAALADRESRDTYNLVLYGSPEDYLAAFLPRAFREQQYVELTQLRPDDVIVNAGIGSGWDVPYLVAANRGRGRHILVDPIRLHTADGPCGHLIDRCGLEFADCGLWDRTEELVFTVDQYGMVHSDRPAGEGYTGKVHKAALRRLDDLVREWRLDRLDLIKMDIEGADERALHGMRETIDRFRPQLAVCLYHEPQHMWTIPGLLMSWLKGYRFYVRLYSYTRFECLIYAIPEERLAEADAPATLPGRFERAGLDFRQMERTWERVIPHERFEAAVRRLGPDPGPAVRAAEGELERAFRAGAPGKTEPVAEVQVGAADFLGTGWDVRCESPKQTWRWVGPDGDVSLFLTLRPDTDHICRFFYQHCESQAGFDQAVLEVNQRPAADREIGHDGTYYYVQWRIPAAVLGKNGQCRMRFRTVAGHRHTAIAGVRYWHAA